MLGREAGEKMASWGLKKTVNRRICREGRGVMSRLYGKPFSKNVYCRRAISRDHFGKKREKKSQGTISPDFLLGTASTRVL